MKLRTKILLWLGILLFLMILILYVLPAYFVKKDVHKAVGKIHDLISQERKQLLESQEIWTTNAYDKSKENLSSLLYMLYETKSISSKLIFNEKNSLSEVWEAATFVAGFDPDVGVVQVHSPKKDQTVVLNTSRTHLYRISSLKESQDVVTFTLQGDLKNQQNPYVGIRLPDKDQKDPDFVYYVFVAEKNLPQEFRNKHPELFEQVESFKTTKEPRELYPNNLKNWNFGCAKTPGLIDLKRPHISNIGSLKIDQSREFSRQPKSNSSDCLGITLEELRELTLAFSPKSKKGFYWALKMHMIRLLTPIYVNGLELDNSSESISPEGLIRVNAAQEGFAIFSNQIFKKMPLFDDRLFYEEHRPKNGPTVASDTAIFVEDDKAAYMGKVLLLDSTYLTLGAPLENFARDLALSSNQTILMQVKDNFWLGFDGNGNPLSQDVLTKFTRTGFDHKKVSAKEEKIFDYSLLANLDEGKVRLFQIHGLNGEKTIIGTLLKLEHQLSKRISLQLSLIFLAALLLILLFFVRVGLHVIHPITKLAEATADVVNGRYEEVNLPEMGESQDEIATLTHSFADMVKGLQEREKIRGVLDKVVSKDVADEILRTQIHLGGEDRVVTMLFSDIRGFSHLTENLSPQETIHVLNACMTKISRVIEGEGGVIDKYVGDEVMAIFGAPTRHPNHSLRAVSSGMLILETLKKWNVQRIHNHLPPIEMGIAVHTGLVVAGNMGAEDRLNYTVLGANVNLAARLCEVAERNQLLITESTLKEPDVEESFYVKALSPLSLKGFSEPVKIYEVLGFKWETTSE